MSGDLPFQNPSSPAFSPSTSLAQAATLNSALSHSESNEEAIITSSSSPAGPVGLDLQTSNGIEHRRSSVRMRLASMDPSLPAPGELAMSPVARQRAPSLSSPQSRSRQQSLSELHQEAEYEQEAQFNRLRTIIRAHQEHLDALNAQDPDNNHQNSANLNVNASAIEDTPNASNNHSGNSTPASVSHTTGTNIPIRQSPHLSAQQHPRASHYRSRESSSAATSSPTAPFLNTSTSPTLDDSAMSSLGLGLSHTTSSSSSLRDEATFYQAETSMFVRENQMLRRRIRELEGQLAEIEGEDVHRSHLREV